MRDILKITIIVVLGLTFIISVLLSISPNENLVYSKYQSSYDNIVNNAIFPEMSDDVYAFKVITKENDIVFYCEEKQLMQIKNNLLNEISSYKMVLKHLDNYGGLPDDAEFSNFEYVYIYKVNESSLQVVEKYPLWSTIKFKRTLKDLPVVGPGGEIDILLGEEGQLLGLTKIWRTIIEEKKISLISPEDAINQLYLGNTINKLQSPTNITINKIELGYYEYGADHIQNIIEPVWIFSGYTTDNDYFYLCVEAKNKAQ